MDLNRTSQPFDFLGLPIELRLRIYEAILSQTVVLIKEKWSFNTHKPYAYSSAPNILLVSTNIYHEAIDVYYRHATFTFFRARSIFEWLEDLPQRSRVQVGHIHWNPIREYRDGELGFPKVYCAKSFVSYFVQPQFYIVRSQLVQQQLIPQHGVFKIAVEIGDILWTETPLQTFRAEGRPWLERQERERQEEVDRKRRARLERRRILWEDRKRELGFSRAMSEYMREYRQLWRHER